MTSVDILVIVLCVVVVAAVAVSAVIRKVKGKPSGCADCTHCSANWAAAARDTHDDAQKKADGKQAAAPHHCSGCCSGCANCAHSLPSEKSDDNTTRCA